MAGITRAIMTEPKLAFYSSPAIGGPAISQGTIYLTAKDGQLLTFALAGANR